MSDARGIVAGALWALMVVAMAIGVLLFGVYLGHFIVWLWAWTA